MRMSIATLTLLLVITFSPFGTFAQSTGTPQSPVNPFLFQPSISIGYSFSAFREFNQKLSYENNHPIHGGITGSAEPFTLQIPKISLAAPTVSVGLEVVQAASRTQHGAFTKVTWNLPVVGVYLSPMVRLNDRIYLRPLGVGYYMLGNSLLRADLTITGQNGRLEVARNQVGWLLGVVGVNLARVGPSAFFAEGGYRVLTFTNVATRPRDGFELPPGLSAQPSNLPQALQYSGAFFRLGVRFNLQKQTNPEQRPVPLKAISER